MANSTAKTRRMVQLSLLLALEAVLTFTPIGFIMIPPISITIMHIPVIIGAVLLGYRSGAFLGAAFGVFSMLRATTSPNPGDLPFNPFASGNPLASIAMAVLPRIALGLVAALVYSLLRKHVRITTSVAAASVCACLVHSLGVLGLLSMLFAALPLREVFMMIIQVNGIIELLAATVVSTAVCAGVVASQRHK